MILLFVLLFIILGLLLQRYFMIHGLDALESDYWPEQNIVDPEDEFDIVISLENKKRWTLHYIKVKQLFYQGININANLRGVQRDPGTGNHIVTISTWIKPGQKIRVRIPISIPQRGRYVLCHPNIFGGDFLGMKEIMQEINKFREIVVAPKEYDKIEVMEVLGNFLGDYSARRFLLEDPILTIGFREYTGREPMKMISWKQSARSQMLMVKEYDHTIEPVISVILNIETDAVDQEMVLEKCFSLVRSVCNYLENKGIPYDFYTNALQRGSIGEDYMIGEGLGRHHFEKILESLGRSMYKSMFSCEKLLELSETSGGKDRGKIIITPQEESLHLGLQMRSCHHQILVLDASKI